MVSFSRFNLFGVRSTKAALSVCLATVLFLTPLIAATDAEGQLRRRGANISKKVTKAIQKNIEIKVRRLLLKLRVENSAGPVSAFDLDRNGRVLATASADGAVRLWDLGLGRQVRRFQPIADPLVKLRFTPGGNRFLALTASGTLHILSTQGSGNPLTISGPGQSVARFLLSPDGAFVAAVGRDQRIRLYALSTSPTLIATLNRKGDPVTALDIGRTGQHLLTTDGDRIKLWEVGSGAVIGRFTDPGGGVSALRFGSNETEFFSAGGDGSISRWRADEETPVEFFTGAEGRLDSLVFDRDGSRLLAARGSRLLLWRTEDPNQPTVIEAHAEGISGVRFDFGSSRIVSAGEDGLTRMWDVETGDPVVSLISTTNGWAVVDAKGRFDGSERALRNVQWANETHVLAAENFSESRYEPGLLVKARLGGDLITDPQTAIEQGIDPPPVVSIEAPDRTTAGSDGKIDVSVLARDEGGGVDEVRLFQNGKIVDPEGATRRTLEADDEESRQSVSVTYRVRPEAGKNTFSAEALSRERVLGNTEFKTVDVVASVTKPVLHVLAIGINRYKEPDLSLNYARVDAEGILAAARTGFGDIFADHRAYQVFDDEATVAGIRRALENLEDTSPQDVVIIYYAGHGEAVGDEFYIVPYDFPLPYSEESMVELGMPSAEFRKHLTRIGARRVILLVDACKSGTAVSALQDYVDRRALRHIGSAVGLHIVAATAKSQLAAELVRLKHGVFTYSVLRGLSGEADRTPRDGYLTVREMIRYAEEKVPQLSREFADHQQWPLVFSRGLDFTLRKTSAP